MEHASKTAAKLPARVSQGISCRICSPRLAEGHARHFQQRYSAKASATIFATGFVVIDKDATSDGIFEYLDGRTQNRPSSISQEVPPEFRVFPAVRIQIIGYRRFRFLPRGIACGCLSTTIYPLLQAVFRRIGKFQGTDIAGHPHTTVSEIITIRNQSQWRGRKEAQNKTPLCKKHRGASVCLQPTSRK